MKIIAPCLYPNEEPASLMKRSAEAHGLSVLLYGVGKTFTAHGADAQVVQLIPVLEAIQDEIVLVTDSKDVLFFAGEEEIMEKFHSCDSPLVMSAEKGCWPPEEEVIYGMPTAPYGYKHVNAGQFIGKKDYVVHCLQHLLDNYRFKYGGLDNSQGWWPLAWLRKELEFKLDSYCRLFQTLSSGEKLIEKDGRPFNEETKMLPCSVHFNGNGSSLTPYYDFYRRYYGEPK